MRKIPTVFRTVRILGLIILLFASVLNLPAGDLDDFEDSITNDPASGDKKESVIPETDDDFGYQGETTLDKEEKEEENPAVKAAAHGVMAGAYLNLGFFILTLYSSDLAMGKSVTYKKEIGENRYAEADFKRYSGCQLVPFIRANSAAMLINKDIWGINGTFEAGLGPLAMRVQHFQFFEILPEDIMNSDAIQLLWRMVLPPVMEIDLGVGGQLLNGNNQHVGLNLSLFFRYSPVEWFTVEFLPELWTFGNEGAVIKLEGVLLFNFKWFSLRGGYLGLLSDEYALGGPFAGIEFRF